MIWNKLNENLAFLVGGFFSGNALERDLRYVSDTQ